MSLPTTIQPNDTQQNVQINVFLLFNGTVVNQPDPYLETVELVLLGIVFLISLCGNTFLLVTIISSYTLREETFNVLIANFSTIFLIETTVNMSIALLFLAADKWHLGNIGCAISSFTVQIVTMEITFGLSMMSLQSMMLMKHPYEFQKIWTVKKQVVATAIFWAAGILLCLPLLLESIQSQVFLTRYGCAFTGSDGFVYILFITIWCYGIMIIIGIGCLINLAIYQYREYKVQARKHGVNFSEVFVPGGLWAEWINVKLVLWLTLFYLILEFPYIVMHHVTGLTNSTNSTLPSDTPPRHETALTWFRYLYPCIFAFLAFKLRKDIRYKFKNLLPCCRPNVVRDHSPVPAVKYNKKKETRKNSIPPINLSTPVLYISPEGLCLRQLAPPIKSFLNYSQNDKPKKAPNFISYLCDVEPVSVVEDYTLDYTSELDESSGSMYRRSSKESEISLIELRNSDTFKNPIMPSKDLDSNISELLPKPSLEEKPLPKPVESSSRKKTVRFSDTVTFYRALTPRVETPTPGWVTTTSDTSKQQTNSRRRHSKIPTLIHPAAHTNTTSTPWKVEFNNAYTIKSPPPRLYYQEPERKARNITKNQQENFKGAVRWMN